MINLSGMKIKNQLILIVVVSVVIMNIFLLAYDLKAEDLLMDKTKIYEENTLETIRKEAHTVGKDVINVANTLSYNSQIQRYLTSEDPLLRVELSKYLREMMHYLANANQNILYIKITDSHGYSDSFSRIANIDRKFESEYKDILDSLESPRFSSLIINDYATDANNRFSYALMLPIYDINDQFKVRERIGRCTIFITANYMQQLMGEAVLSEEPNFFVIDQNNVIVASNHRNSDKDFVGNKFAVEDVKSKDKGDNIKLFNEKTYYMKEMDIETMGWKAINLTSTRYISNDLHILRRLRYFLLGIMLLSMLLINSIIINQITKPINTIIDFIKDSKDGYKGRRIGQIKHREMGELAIYINNMLDISDEMNRKIVESQASLYEMELAKRQSDLYALQSQINPHFLYNTLECIRSIATVYDVREIVSITVSMASILKYSIKGGDIVNIDDEVNCIKEYINIMNIRYQGKFKIQIDMEERIMEQKIPKMILQPIIENAIYHGLEPKLGDGTLIIKGYKSNDESIRFEILDNGVGMDRMQLEELSKGLRDSRDNHMAKVGRSRSSIGLFNIDNKIRIMSNDKYGLNIESKAGEGTKVIVEAPILQTFIGENQ